MSLRKLVLVLALVVPANIGFSADLPVPDPIQQPDVPFRLFRTSNIWTFLKLDTRTGKVWQIQYDVNGTDRFTNTLNSIQLIGDEHASPGRFTLYPTTNIYNFLLLDQFDGRTWQVQWSAKRTERLIIPIPGADN